MKGKGKKNIYLVFFISFSICFLFTAVLVSGMLSEADYYISDIFYQKPRTSDGLITVIGIDQKAVDRIGPLPWPRHVIAEVIEKLNAEADKKPAVIGLDILYTGEGDDKEADKHLADAALSGGNVVTASLAYYGSTLVAEGDVFYMDNSHVEGIEEPFSALKNASGTGHINVMTDPDGILRHALAYLDYEGERYFSFSRIIYERYCEASGISVNALPFTEDDDGVYYVPFTAGPGGYYEGVSVSDILEGNFDPGYYAGKIVLIGPYSPLMQDEYRTSSDHSRPMYGVEFQANLIDAFRSPFFPSEADKTLETAAVFFVSLFSILFFLDNKFKFSLILWSSVSVLWVLLCALLYRGGVILHPLWVPLNETLLFIICLSYNYICSLRDEKKISELFGRYVDKSIIRTLLEVGGDELELGGKLYDIAALFVDIRGFTTMSENLDPPEVVDIINQYLELTTNCIMRYHGTLDKFVGDCTMAFWNAPVHQEDYVYLACQAAMDMVEGAAALGERLKEKYGRSVAFGVGVHTGPAVIGNIGSPMHMDYTAIGDTVNTASRLESNAPGGKILISRRVADMLGNRAQTTSLGNTIRLKGKNNEFEILTLDALERRTTASLARQEYNDDEDPKAAASALRRTPEVTGEWECPHCGLVNNTLFCPDCGLRKPDF